MSVPDPGAPLGFFGGTFDPVHHGHLRLATEAAAQLGLATVIFSPAGRPPHRAPPQAAAVDRVRMVERAIDGSPLFRLDAGEAGHDGASYTVEAIERLRRTLGAARPIVVLLGSDAFAGLDRWHRWQALLDLAHLAVTRRPGHPLESAALPTQVAAAFAARRGDAADLAAAPGGRIVGFDMPALDISATAIRQAIAAGERPVDLLPAAVLDYIQTHRLYRTPRSAPSA